MATTTTNDISTNSFIICISPSTRLEYMEEIETKINTEIGYRFWKKYVTAAFWSYISHFCLRQFVPTASHKTLEASVLILSNSAIITIQLL